jgi:hypothetical protein
MLEYIVISYYVLLADRHGSTKESNTQLKKLEEVMCVALKYNMFLLFISNVFFFIVIAFLQINDSYECIESIFRQFETVGSFQDVIR